MEPCETMMCLIFKPKTCNNPEAFKTSLGKSLKVEDKQLTLSKHIQATAMFQDKTFILSEYAASC